MSVRGLTGAALCLLFATPASADQFDWSATSRLRFESVSQDNALSDADALTGQLRAGFTWTLVEDWTVLADVEAVFDLAGDYNNLTNGDSGFSVVADPDGTELNRVQLSYSGLEKTKVTLGRQRIKLDNDRFIGNVGWRQNEQTFDGLTVSSAALENTVITAGYLTRAHRILGDDHPNGNIDLAAPIVNVKYSGIANTTIVGYGYFLDFEDNQANSHKTLGLRASHASSLVSVPIRLGVEYAKQTPYRNGSDANDADYLRVEASVTLKPVTFSAGQETLSGDGVYGFQTPFATGHAFNGWSDVFLATPANGVEDGFLAVAAKVAGTNLKAVRHSFSADTGGIDYGTEINLIATRKFNESLSGGLKLASYQARDFAVDTDKLWLFATWKWQ